MSDPRHGVELLSDSALTQSGSVLGQAFQVVHINEGQVFVRPQGELHPTPSIPTLSGSSPRPGTSAETVLGLTSSGGLH